MALDKGVKLIGVRQTGKVGPDSTIRQVMEVSFQVDDHGPFVEDIDVSRYTTELVEQAVGRRVAEIRATANLFGG